MSVQHQSIAVTTSPVSILAGTTDASHSTGVDRSVVLQNLSTQACYIGGPGVTTTNYGYRLGINGECTLDLKSTDVPYIVAGAAATVHALYLGG